MRTLPGLTIEIDIGDSADQRLLGAKRYGTVLAEGQNANAIEYAVVELTGDLAYEYEGDRRLLRRVFVVPRHVGRGLARLLTRLWRLSITVYMIPVGEHDGDFTADWEAIRRDTIAIALIRRTG